MTTEINSSLRKKQLKDAAESYFNGLKNVDFGMIPFHRNIVLRAPIAPGGAENPISGIDDVKKIWWEPLVPALRNISINVHDFFYNDSLTGIICEADIFMSGPGLTLRVADRFYIDEEGKITSQENHFDASPLKSANS